MKLLSLNIWGGKIYQPLLDFISKYNEDIDIFCLQEVYKGGQSDRPHLKDMQMDIYFDIQKILANYQGYFSESQTNEEGLGMFIKKSIKVSSISEKFVFRQKDAIENFDARTMGRLIQILQCRYQNQDYSIVNFHGLWNGGGKTDTPDRLLQSSNVKNEVNRLSGKVVLTGDFNLEPSTESIRILEEGMVNLIKKYKVTSTRSSHYEKPVKFADYILVSPDVEVKNFKVLADEVSDHLPLFLDFN